MSARILVVEDSSTVRRLVESVLREGGFAVETAPGADEGLERALRGGFDLAVVDDLLSTLDGQPFAEVLRATPSWCAAPVVRMSTRPDAVGTLGKPFSSAQLIHAVRAAMARPRRSVPAAQDSPLPPAPTAEPLASAAVRAERIARWSSGPEVARDRFVELLVQHLGSAVREVLEAGVAAHDELIVQAFRHHCQASVAAELARELRSLDPSLRGATGFEGTLGVVALADVLRLANASGLAGVLRAERSARGGAVGVDIAVRPGVVDQVVGAGLGTDYRLGRFLVSSDALSRADLDGFIASGAARGLPLGRALVAGRKISPDDLAAGLRAQSLELFGEASRWLGGRFRFVPGETLSVGDASLGIGTEECIDGAVRRTAEWESIESSLSLDHPVSLRDASLSASISDPIARRMIGVVDGERSARELARDLELGPLEAGRSLVLLVRARIVSVAAGAARGA